MIRTYKLPYGPEHRMLRVVRIGDWFHWVPFNGRPRLIVKAFGRQLTWVKRWPLPELSDVPAKDRA